MSQFRRNGDFFKSIENLSMTEGPSPVPLVPNSEKMFSGDHIAENCSKSGETHCSVDGLYYDYEDYDFDVDDVDVDESFYLLLVEFKSLKDDLNYETVESLKLELKLKPLESIFCVLPRFFENYANSDKEQLNEILMKSLKKYFLVTNYKNKTKGRRYTNADYFKITRLEPYPFVQVKILSVVAFQEYVAHSSIIN